jgi:hypothetical protein
LAHRAVAADPGAAIPFRLRLVTLIREHNRDLWKQAQALRYSASWTPAKSRPTTGSVSWRLQVHPARHLRRPTQ